MLKRARTAGLVPALVVSIVIAISLIAPASARFNALAPSCGYGYGYPPAAPTVAYVSPNFGPTTGGTTVTITGSGFCGTISAVNFRRWTHISLEVQHTAVRAYWQRRVDLADD